MTGKILLKPNWLICGFLNRVAEEGFDIVCSRPTCGDMLKRLIPEGAEDLSADPGTFNRHGIYFKRLKFRLFDWTIQFQAVTFQEFGKILDLIYLTYVHESRKSS